MLLIPGVYFCVNRCRIRESQGGVEFTFFLLKQILNFNSLYGTIIKAVSGSPWFKYYYSHIR